MTRRRNGPLSAKQRLVLKFIGLQAKWTRSLGPFKPVADRLIEVGLVERVKPPGGRARNMVALTESGRSTLFRMEGPDE